MARNFSSLFFFSFSFFGDVVQVTYIYSKNVTQKKNWIRKMLYLINPRWRGEMARLNVFFFFFFLCME